MVEFKGELNLKSYKPIIHRLNKELQIIIIVVYLIIAVPCFLLYCLTDFGFALIAGAISLTVIALTSFILLFFAGEKFHRETLKMFPKYIAFENGIIELGYNSQKHREFYYENIKGIADYGEFYYVFLKIPNRNQSFVCQKGLITEGTIEEFEETFSDVIVRKNKDRIGK
ncbi:MAG: hypothetical protein J5697_03480 [Clostridia bacterium]|nr:hypothetical protein [Clostridia bacterium]